MNLHTTDTRIAADLATHESTIERGLRTFVEVGQSLQAIRDERLYREHFDRFEDYCRERWGWNDRRASQLIAAAGVAANVSTIVEIGPATESQARPLTQLPPDEQADAWEEVVDEAEETGEKITAKKVQQVVAKRINGQVKPISRVTIQIDVLDACQSAGRIIQATSREFSQKLASALQGVY